MRCRSKHFWLFQNKTVRKKLRVHSLIWIYFDWWNDIILLSTYQFHDITSSFLPCILFWMWLAGLGAGVWNILRIGCIAIIQALAFSAFFNLQAFFSNAARQNGIFCILNGKLVTQCHSNHVAIQHKQLNLNLSLCKIIHFFLWHNCKSI